MDASTMLLAMDAGNSFVKLGYHDGHNWRTQYRLPLADFEGHLLEWAEQPAPRAVIVSEVAGDRVRTPLARLLEAWNRQAFWVVPQHSGYGVTNSYDNPEQLGADRWAALIGARQITGNSAVVLSVGTAATIDALTSAGTFLGGMILPGIAAMQEILARKTSSIRSEAGQFSPFPTNTADAVYSGALAAIAGASERLRQDLLRAGRSPVEVLVTGGAAGEVAPLFGPAARVTENLVLAGLLQIAREEHLI
jgi:type III pantothenate kinase